MSGDVAGSAFWPHYLRHSMGNSQRLKFQIRAELVQGHLDLGWVTENSFPFTFVREIDETDQDPSMNPSVMTTEISQACLLLYLFPWTICHGDQQGFSWRSNDFPPTSACWFLSGWGYAIHPHFVFCIKLVIPDCSCCLLSNVGDEPYDPCVPHRE